MEKYEFVKSDTVDIFGEKLTRIRAVRGFGDVKAGDLGGYIQSERNLSHEGNAWVYGNARVFGNALVFGKARVRDDEKIRF